MESLEALKGRIEGARTLRTIVRTMKILAAVGVRQEAKAAESLSAYVRTIELGLEVVLKTLDAGTVLGDEARAGSGQPVEAIVLGSDMGMCGQFNERIASFAVSELSKPGAGSATLLAVGDRAAERLADLGRPATSVIPCPANPTTGVGLAIRAVLQRLAAWREERGGGEVLAFYNRHTGRGTDYKCRRLRLLPVDTAYLEELRSRPWKSRSLPIFRMDGTKLLHALLRGSVYGTLYLVFLASLESENAARLEAMEAAEKHIDEHLEDLRAWFNEARQEAITAELLDIVAGVEAAATQAARSSKRA
jgi:F-type H+-transporting ATPase subunit gamma